MAIDKKGRFLSTMTIQERFERNCTPEPNSGCWLWTGFVTKKGYGSFSIDRAGHSSRAHRAAWAIYNGVIPEGLYVCHKCDNTSCVNPEHLFLGSHKENMADMRLKNRSARLYGSKNHSTSLSEDEVAHIRSGSMRQKDLAKMYSVHQSTISKIQHGKRWRII